MDLATTYLGLRLPNPLVAGAGPLGDDLDMARALEDNGASMLVMRSLFEEEITSDQLDAFNNVERFSDSFAEASSFEPDSVAALGPYEYLEHLQALKRALGIPVIASLNGTTPGGWCSYAGLIEQAGADGLELHIYHAASDMSLTAADVERRFLDIVRDVKGRVRIPVAVKIAPLQTAFANFAGQLDAAGADALVLFTRFHRADIDVEELEVIRTLALSDSSELPMRLRGAAAVSGRIRASIAITGGVHTGIDVIKSTMAGAHVTQMVSALLRHGPGHLLTVRHGIEAWMTEHEWNSLGEMRGNMGLDRIPDPAAYEAYQFPNGTAMKTVQARPAAARTVTAEKKAATTTGPWHGFKPGLWQNEINVRDFIQQNYEPYDGDGSFLTAATPRTQKLWAALNELFAEERRKGVLDVSQIPSSITAHQPGYIDRDNEIIVGLQTDAPLKRAIMPNGGLRLVLNALKTYGYEADPHVVEAFTKYRKTHNDAVFDAYTADVRRCRSSHILTGLPDAYGRGRIIGDYRRVALYGVARLVERKQKEKNALDAEMSTDDVIRDREELAEQVRALKELQQMASTYGFDISIPASNAREAVQWLYFGYLAGVKEQNGAAMSLGRTSTFLDIYFARDLASGLLTESQIQEIVDDFVIKLRIVRFLRTPEYDELFAGDPTWVTESIGGMGDDGRSLVTRSSFRFLQTLYNLGPAPEPNLTIWYSPRLPDGFRHFAAKVAVDTSSIQFESDEIMRRAWGDDGAIACCVSPMAVGKQMQFFGARANLAKCLLHAINGGRDELSGDQIGPAGEPVQGDVLDFDDVLDKFERMMDWLARVYVNAMNVIHYMHDKYAYERIEMALHDYAPLRTMAFGMAGLSVVADSLSAIRYARVRVVRDATGLVTDYQTEGTFPLFGNNDNRVDQLATWVVSTFMSKLRKYPTYRHALHTQSILTITSNVVYGKATGNTPDGRRKGEPFAPGANPMHGRDTHGIHAAAASVAKIPYRDAADGISLTASLVPEGLGRLAEDRIRNLTAMLDAFFSTTGFHMNVNVLNRDMLVDAMEHPEKYPHLTIRVSGYAVNFVRLTREQQMDVINRTFHGAAAS